MRPRSSLWSHCPPVLLLLFQLVASVASDELSVQVNGQERTAIFEPPPSNGAKCVPMILSLHPLNTPAEVWFLATRKFVDAARPRGGALVVWPRGLKLAWNGGTCCFPAMEYPFGDSAQDVSFLKKLISKFEDQYCVHSIFAMLQVLQVFATLYWASVRSQSECSSL